MGSFESQQDTYFVLFAAILNISVLKSVRPLIARKGLEVRPEMPEISLPLILVI